MESLAKFADLSIIIISINQSEKFDLYALFCLCPTYLNRKEKHVVYTQAELNLTKYDQIGFSSLACVYIFPTVIDIS